MSGIPREEDVKTLAHQVYRGEVYLVPITDTRAIQSSFPVIFMADLTPEQIADLGALWERTEKRIPGVGINGRPVFMSCHLLHRDDLAELDRLIQAIEFAALGVS